MRQILAAMTIWFCATGVGWTEEMRAITVVGQGSVAAVPDMATISMGVTHEASVAAEAMAQVSAGVTAVLNRLSEAGVEARDMQTSSLSLQPVWSNHGNDGSQPPRITGFVASNQVTVRVRDLSGLGAVLDTVVQDGANTFNGLQFAMQEPAPLEAEARAAAVRDGMARAAQLAEAAGVTLGPVRSISENGPVQGMMMEMAAARSMDKAVAAGELSLEAQVSMVFSIAD